LYALVVLVVLMLCIIPSDLMLILDIILVRSGRCFNGSFFSISIIFTTNHHWKFCDGGACHGHIKEAAHANLVTRDDSVDNVDNKKKRG